MKTPRWKVRSRHHPRRLPAPARRSRNYAYAYDAHVILASSGSFSPASERRSSPVAELERELQGGRRAGRRVGHMGQPERPSGIARILTLPHLRSFAQDSNITILADLSSKGLAARRHVETLLGAFLEQLRAYAEPTRILSGLNALGIARMRMPSRALWPRISAGLGTANAGLGRARSRPLLRGRVINRATFRYRVVPFHDAVVVLLATDSLPECRASLVSRGCSDQLESFAPFVVATHGWRPHRRQVPGRCDGSVHRQGWRVTRRTWSPGSVRPEQFDVTWRYHAV
jgi:hypothetical protein